MHPRTKLAAAATTTTTPAPRATTRATPSAASLRRGDPSEPLWTSNLLDHSLLEMQSLLKMTSPPHWIDTTDAKAAEKPDLAKGPSHQVAVSTTTTTTATATATATATCSTTCANQTARAEAADAPDIKGPTRQQMIDAMRAEVDRLQSQYEKLCALADLSRARKKQKVAAHQSVDAAPTCSKSTTSATNATNTSTSSTSSNTQASHEVTVNDLLSHVPTPSQSHFGLAQEMRRLKHENAHLRTLMAQNRLFEYKIEMLACDLGVAKAPKSFCRLTNGSGRLMFVPFSVEESQAIVRRDLEQNALRKPDFWNEQASKKLPLGWRGFAEIENDATVRFQMTKVWPERPQNVCNVVWNFLNTTSERGRNGVYSMPRRLELLQQVTKDIAVFRRTTTTGRSNSCTSHSVYMLYRLQVGENFIVGCVPLPLWGSGNSASLDDLYGKRLLRDRESLVISQWYFVFEPAVVRCATTHELMAHTRTFRWGYYACETREESNLWSVEMVEALLRFEHLLLFPLVNVQIHH